MGSFFSAFPNPMWEKGIANKKTAQAGEEAPTWTVSRKGETRVEGPDTRDSIRPRRRTRRTGDEVSQPSASS